MGDNGVDVDIRKETQAEALLERLFIGFREGSRGFGVTSRLADLPGAGDDRVAEFAELPTYGQEFQFVDAE